MAESILLAEAALANEFGARFQARRNSSGWVVEATLANGRHVGIRSKREAVRTWKSLDTMVRNLADEAGVASIELFFA